MRPLPRLFPLLIFSVVPLFAQERVDPKHLHERVLAVVPIIGAGTYADPKRPLFAPGPNEERVPGGIESFEWRPTDDGNFAVVEFVARDRKAFEKVLSDARVVKAFEKGKDTRENIEKELRKYRKDFSIGAVKEQRP